MKLNELQSNLSAQKIDALIVSRNNQFLGQDILIEENRLYQLTGFDGSAGNLIVFADKKSVLFVDGRYELQAAQQTDPSQVEVVITNGSTLATWMQNNLSQKMTIAYNPWCHPINEVEYWNRNLKNINFIEDRKNLSGAILSAKECNIFEHDICFSGISMDEKISRFTSFIAESKLDAYLITTCDAVSWLLNLRSDCLPDTPIVRAYALINAAGEVSLFTNDFAKLEEELDHYRGKTIGTAFNQTPSAILGLMKSRKIWLDNLANPIMLWKAIKNPVELSNLQTAHQRDAAAVIRFLIWLENNWSTQSELSVVNKLYEVRSQGENFFSNSFETIAGYAAHGAIVHYRPTAESNLPLTGGSLLLLDSGAQYYDGTTDITRTIAIGTPSPQMIKDFSTVLKAHINLSSTYFPEGTSGQALDTLARAPLWKQGHNYNHGTGHGVGFFLNVHEGPQNISSRGASAPLQEDMITSIEPGCYLESQYGIRLENLVKIQKLKDTQTSLPLLKFVPLTQVPLDKRLIDKYLLNQEEINWLNSYHQEVYQQISPLLQPVEQKWLQEACSPL